MRASAVVLLLLVALASTPANAGSDATWVPEATDRWQYQLEGKVDVDICKTPFSGGECVRPDVFDIDLYAPDGKTPNAKSVAAIHDRGAHAVCYISAGTAEKFRPDYRKYVKFDKKVGGNLIGKPFSDRFSNENYLDIGPKRYRKFILGRLAERTKLCAEAGFDGVEYDNVATYEQSKRTTGFKVKAKEQLDFNMALAEIAHANGLAAGLKNDLGQLEALEPSFDFAVNEQCLQYRECTNNPSPGYRAFLNAGKAVFQVEYRQEPKEFCAEASEIGLSSIQKARDFSLRADPWVPCR